MANRPHHYSARYRHDLSPRQVEVLERMAKGETNAEIAEGIGVTLDGAKWHVREILGKLGMESREEAVSWWHAYHQPTSRAGRMLTALGGAAGWKIGAAATAASVTGVALFAFLAGAGPLDVGAEPGAKTPVCAAGNLIWSTEMEAGADGSLTTTLFMELRDPDWYEGILHALGRERHVDSPCVIDEMAEVSLWELIPIPDAPPQLDRVPLVPKARIPAEGSPASVPVQITLRSGPPTAVIRASLTNWCIGPLVSGIEFRMPNPDGPANNVGSLRAELEQVPSCLDSAALPALTVSPADPRP